MRPRRSLGLATAFSPNSVVDESTTPHVRPDPPKETAEMQNQGTRMLRFLAIASMLFIASGIASSQEPATGTWQKLTHQPTFQTDTALLLTDGTVMMHQYNTGTWWKLTPTTSGSYVNGTWTQLASMQSGYAPLYF